MTTKRKTKTTAACRKERRKKTRVPITKEQAIMTACAISYQIVDCVSALLSTTRRCWIRCCRLQSQRFVHWNASILLNDVSFLYKLMSLQKAERERKPEQIAVRTNQTTKDKATLRRRAKKRSQWWSTIRRCSCHHIQPNTQTRCHSPAFNMNAFLYSFMDSIIDSNQSINQKGTIETTNKIRRFFPLSAFTTISSSSPNHSLHWNDFWENKWRYLANPCKTNPKSI